MTRFYTAKDECIKSFFAQCQSALNKVEEAIHAYKPTLMNRRFMTDAQLSQKLGVARRTLQDYRDRGVIPFYKLDGKILYDEDEIETILANTYRAKFSE